MERAEYLRILGVWVSNDLSWNVGKIIPKCRQTLNLLKQLQQTGVSLKDLITYYKAVIRAMTKYTSQEWHPGLTTDQIENL